MKKEDHPIIRTTECLFANCASQPLDVQILYVCVSKSRDPNPQHGFRKMIVSPKQKNKQPMKFGVFEAPQNFEITEVWTNAS